MLSNQHMVQLWLGLVIWKCFQDGVTIICTWFYRCQHFKILWPTPELSEKTASFFTRRNLICSVPPNLSVVIFNCQKSHSRSFMWAKMVKPEQSKPGHPPHLWSCFENSLICLINSLWVCIRTQTCQQVDCIQVPIGLTTYEFQLSAKSVSKITGTDLEFLVVHEVDLDEACGFEWIEDGEQYFRSRLVNH